MFVVLTHKLTLQSLRKAFVVMLQSALPLLLSCSFVQSLAFKWRGLIFSAMFVNSKVVFYKSQQPHTLGRKKVTAEIEIVWRLAALRRSCEFSAVVECNALQVCSNALSPPAHCVTQHSTLNFTALNPFWKRVHIVTNNSKISQCFIYFGCCKNIEFWLYLKIALRQLCIP